MKTTQTALIVVALAALMSGCASTMTARNGEFAVSGANMDPIHATAVAGGVTTNQYNAETQRLVAMKMLDKGLYPGYGYGVSGGSYGYDSSGDYWRHYRSRGIIPYVQQPAVPQTSVTVVPQTPGPGGYATQQDLQRVEEKADDSLCMHYKAKLKAAGKPITPCPPIKK